MREQRRPGSEPPGGARAPEAHPEDAGAGAGGGGSPGKVSALSRRPRSGTIAARRQVWIENLDESQSPTRERTAATSAAAPFSRQQSGGDSAGAALAETPMSRLGTSFGSASSPTLGRSRPSTAGSVPHRSSRFSSEEKNCFRRLPTPSSTCEDKAANYFATTGRVRQIATEKGLSSLPVNKGEFHNHPALKFGHESPSKQQQQQQRHKQRTLRRGAVIENKIGAPLEVEAVAAHILDEIYPVSTEGPRTLSPRHRLHIHREAPNPPSQTQPHPQPQQQSLSVPSTPGGGLHPARRQGMTATPSMQRLQGMQSVPSSPAPTPQQKQQENDDTVMARLRSVLLGRYSTLKEAIEAFTNDVPADRDLNKAEWRNMLSAHGFHEFSGRKDINSIFKLLDFSGDGYVSVREFHIAIELSAPVRSIEALRRRWLARGFRSMNLAIRKMSNEDIDVQTKRLTLEEFGAYLSMTHITDPEEHRSLFHAICDEDSGTTSIEELHCAIAAVSPSLLLEDLRERMARKYKGDFDKAFYAFSMDHGSELSLKEFVRKATVLLDLNQTEAEKAFRDIDIDHGGTVSVQEFKNSLAVVEPSLFIEDLRWKVRQRFHAIRDAVNKAFADEVLDGEQTTETVEKPRFQEVLEPLGLIGSETETLFDLLDLDGDGELTCGEFLAGVRRFLPAYTLEDLRLRCCQKFESVDKAVSPLKKRRTELVNIRTFAKKLGSAAMVDTSRPDAGVQIQAIFDLLDVYHLGEASIGRLIAALSASGAGSHAKLPEEERNQKAREDIAGDVAPYVRKINEFKTQVRFGLDWDTHGAAWGKDTGRPAFVQPAELAQTPQASTNAGGLARSASSPAGFRRAPTTQPRARSAGGNRSFNRQKSGAAVTTAAKLQTEDSVEVAASTEQEGAMAVAEVAATLHKDEGIVAFASTTPKLRTTTQEQLPDHVHAVPSLVADCKTRSELMIHDIQDTFGVVWTNMHETPHHLRPTLKMQRSLQNYFESAAMKMSERVPYTTQVQSRFTTYQQTRLAEGALRAPKVKGA